MIDRFWGQHPYWFSGLDHETKIALIADFNLSRLSPDQIQERLDKAQKVKRGKLR